MSDATHRTEFLAFQIMQAAGSADAQGGDADGKPWFPAYHRAAYFEIPPVHPSRDHSM